MSRFRRLILEGRAHREEREAAEAECHRLAIRNALLAHAARHRAKREAAIAAGWDCALTAITSEAADDKPDEGGDDEQKSLPRYAPHPEKLKPRRRRRSNSAHAQTDIEESWDLALEAVAAEAPQAVPQAAPNGSSAAHALARLWTSMFSTVKSAIG